MRNILLAPLLLPACQWLHLRVPMASTKLSQVPLPILSLYSFLHSLITCIPLNFLFSFLSAIPALFLSFLCPCDYMIKALLPMSQWGSTVIMSDPLNNDHVNALSGWSDWRVFQGHGPAWNVTDSGPPFLGKKTHNVYHSDTTKCCCSWVISCWKNIIISLLLGKHFTGSVVSVIVIFGCECVCVCVWPKGSENDLKLWFFLFWKVN